MAQSKAKPLSAAIFKARTRPVPSKLWPTLMVRAEGAPVNTLLESWGAADLGAEPAVTLMITARESTGRTISSKLVVRGPVFMATADNPVKANTIWPGAEDNLTVRFAVAGDMLNFSNREARNFSMWASLDTLPSFRVYREDTALSREEIQDIEGLNDGASYRVVLHTHSVTHMAASLLIAPKSLTSIRARARDWNVPAESNLFPAVDLTSHLTRCDHTPSPLSRQTAWSADQKEPFSQ